MNILGGVLLGVVQGLTEFLPVSSSGHLILARELFGFTGGDGLAYDAVLQLGTLLAVFLYFRRDIWDLLRIRQRTLLFSLLIGTLPALFVGVLLEHYMESIFRSAELVAAMLIAGSGLFLAAEQAHTAQQQRVALPAETSLPVSIRQGFIIGCFQVLALVPGISRSGSTISGGLFLGLTREQAARFSFLLSLPIIFGSGLKKLLDLYGAGGLAGAAGTTLIAGFVSAFVVGYACIAFLLKYLKTHTLHAFVWYRVILAVCVLVLLWFRA